jgi:hypothetical protein
MYKKRFLKIVVSLLLALPQTKVWNQTPSATSTVPPQSTSANQSAVSKDDVQKLEKSITTLNKEFEKLTTKTVQFGLSLGYRSLTGKSRENYEQASISPLDSTLQIAQLERGTFLLSTSAIFNPNLNTKNLKQKIDKSVLAYIQMHQNTTKYTKKEEGAEECQSQTLILNELAIKSRVFINDTGKIDQNQYKSLVEAIEGDDGTSISNAHVRTFIQELRYSSISTKSDKKLARRLSRLLFIRNLTDYVLDRLVISANINLIEFSAAQKDFSFNKSIEGGIGLSYKINEHLFLGANWETFNSRQLYPYLKSREGEKLRYNGTIIPNTDALDVNNNNLYRTAVMEGISFKLIASF